MFFFFSFLPVFKFLLKFYAKKNYCDKIYICYNFNSLVSLSTFTLLCNHHHSVQFSHSVMSDSLRPHEPQHARPPCPSPTPGAYPNSSLLSWWCYPTISSSVVPFSSSPQSFPASGSFQTSQLFVSGGQSIGVSATASVLPVNIQGWFPLGWTGFISLLSKGLSFPTPQFKSINSSMLSFL